MKFSILAFEKFSIVLRGQVFIMLENETLRSDQTWRRPYAGQRIMPVCFAFVLFAFMSVIFMFDGIFTVMVNFHVNSAKTLGGKEHYFGDN